MKHVDPARLYGLFDLAARNAVGLSLHYVESSDEWWAEITSAAKSECLTTREYSFPTMAGIVEAKLFGESR